MRITLSPRAIQPLAGCVALMLPLAAYGQTASLPPIASVSTSAAASTSATSLPPLPPAGTEIFPLVEIRRGLSGIAYTVFQGVNPEPMGVEILGVLKDAIGPGQDMILGRLHGEKAEYTGVVAGMSGSPVYINGRLVGALSYRIGVFSKEPICGITPIEQMLEVRDRKAGSGGMRIASTRAGRADTGRADRSGKLDDRIGSGQSGGQTVAAGGEVQPIETALVFGGFSREAVERFGSTFRELGMAPVAGLGGAAAAGTRQPEPIVPGSAVSAVLVRGDLSISGTCTVTYVDPHQLLACGHPITQFGSVAMPMTKAEVVATLASPLNAFKIINTTETVGEFTEDRASAILGRFGETARMIPVSVEVVPAHVAEGASGSAEDRASGSPDAAFTRVSATQPGLPFAKKDPEGETVPAGNSVSSKGMHFEVLDNRELTPQAMLVSVYQSLSGTNASENQMSYRMSGELSVKGQPPVRMEGVMAPTESGSGAVSAALYVNDRFGRLYGNAMEQPEIIGLRLRMEALPGRRTAVLEGARLGATEVRPGEMLEVEATVHPYQAEAQVVRIKLRVPDTLTSGQMRIVVSDSATIDKLTGSGTGGSPAGVALAGAGARPVAIADAVAQMNRSHANDRVYVTLLEHTAQAGFESESLPGVPLSMANVLEPLKASQKVQLTGESAVEAGSAGLGYALSGLQVLTVDVR